MNKLEELCLKEAEKVHRMQMCESIEYLTTGSIIAFVNPVEKKGNCDLHGSMPAKLFVLMECIRTFSEEYDVDYKDVLNYINTFYHED